MGIRYFPPNRSPADAAVWKELWEHFIHLKSRRGRSEADDKDACGAAEHLLLGHFPEFTLSTDDLHRALTLLLNLPEDAHTWPPEVAYNRVRQMLCKRAPFSRLNCLSFSEVHLVDAAAAGGLSEADQELVLWLSRRGGLTLAEIKARFGWSDDQLAAWMARVVTALLSA